MNYYETKRIFDNFYLIFENYAEDSCLTMGLITGAEKAALIDSGMGVFGTELREVVHGLTEKPVVNILTHGHPDHIAGSVLFHEVYMNERDEPQIPRLARGRRLGDVKMFSHNDPAIMAYAEEHCLDCSGFRYKPMNAGDHFELGGVTLEILTLPGHSLGSVAVYNRAGGYALVGDAFSERVPASSLPSLDSFREMADGIQIFLKTVSEDATLYGGHGRKPVSRSLIGELLQAAREISERRVDNDEDVFLPMSPVPNQKKHSFGRVGISYNPAILSKE